MARYNMSLRLSELAEKNLKVLSKVTNLSMNEVIIQLLEKYDTTELAKVADEVSQIEETLKALEKNKRTLISKKNQIIKGEI